VRAHDYKRRLPLPCLRASAATAILRSTAGQLRWQARRSRHCCASPVPQVQTRGLSKSTPALLKAASSSAAGLSLQGRGKSWLTCSSSRQRAADARSCLRPLFNQQLPTAIPAGHLPPCKLPYAAHPPAVPQHVGKLQAAAAGDVAAAQARPRLGGFASEPAERTRVERKSEWTSVSGPNLKQCQRQAAGRASGGHSRACQQRAGVLAVQYSHASVPAVQRNFAHRVAGRASTTCSPPLLLLASICCQSRKADLSRGAWDLQAHV